MAVKRSVKKSASTRATKSTSASRPSAKKTPARSGSAKPTAAKASGLTVGRKAPDFALPNDQGETIRLSDFAGKKVVVYFYPKDDTPGCTREACSFRDNMGALTRRGAVVLGISRDGAAAHQRFRSKYALEFPLLTDADTKVHGAYGAWGEKTMYGKKITGAIRTTVLVDEQGKVARVWPKVKVDGHVDEVLAAL